MQKNQLIDSQDHFERYCNTIPVFGLSARYEINFIKTFLIPTVVNKKDVEPIVIKKLTNLFRSNLVMFIFLTFETFSEVLTILIHSFNLTRHQRRTDSFHTKGLTTQINGTAGNFRLTKPSKIKLRKCNTLEKEYFDYEKLICSGLRTEAALVKMRLSERPPNSEENSSYLQKVWEHEKKQSFQDFFALVQ